MFAFANPICWLIKKHPNPTQPNSSRVQLGWAGFLVGRVKN